MSKGFDEVGCRKCHQGGKWKVFTDGKKINLVKCSVCGHTVEVANVEIKKESDKDAYPMVMFT